MARSSKNTLYADDWKRVRELFEQCEALPASKRLAFLDGETQDRPDLKREVLTLLEADDSPQSVYDKPLASYLLEARQQGADTQKIAPSPFQPTRLGRYLLLDKLGEGGMAEVFLARTSGPGGFKRYLAVKRVLSGVASDPEFIKMFEMEASLASRLAHANIVHVYDFTHTQGVHLLAMEYVAGQNLMSVLRRTASLGRTIPRELSGFILHEMLQGLAYAHSRHDDRTQAPLGIVHRDVSPRNVMISYEGEVKILDFGISKARNQSKMTRSGSLRGTVDYMSPEVVNAEPVDHRSDLFSASLVLYQMLSGKPLFSGEFLSVIRDIQECELPKKAIAKLDVDEELKAILSRGLQRDPNDRFPDAASYAEAIEAYLHTTSTSSKTLASLMHECFSAEYAREKARFRGFHDLADPAPRPPPRKLPEPVLPVFAQEEATPPRRSPWLVVTSVGFFFLTLIFAVLWRFSPAVVPPAETVVAPEPPEPVAESLPTGAPRTESTRAPEPIPVREEEKVVELPRASDSVAPDRCLAALQSEPPAARVLLNGIDVGRTPVKVALTCHVPIAIELDYPGYEPLKRNIVVKEKEGSLSLILNRVK